MRILFFDIDGTLWNWKNEIPESTKEAIRITREKGNLAFINSGRARGFIQNEDLLGIGFDGIVSGCGTLIEYNGDVIYETEIPEEQAVRIVSGVRRHGWKPVLEGREYLYMDEEEFADDWYGQKLMRELGDRLKPISGEWGRWKMQKLSCNIQGAEVEPCVEEFGNEFDFILHDLAVCELVPRPHSKGTGIKKVCELLGASLSDTFAFGDSVNDMEMLLTAGTAVVMGSGSDRAKAAADYITTGQEEDGIWNACVHFGLV
ncbi:MAG: HAD-IIB family hydrolase [Lachnospiraceae bacterium]|nr:HAD-IIB family hydrolase [Lachnospiraceae bacterium]